MKQTTALRGYVHNHILSANALGYDVLLHTLREASARLLVLLYRAMRRPKQEGRTTDPWRKFNKIEAYDFSGIEEVCADIDTNIPYEVYTLKGMKAGNNIESVVPDIYILRQGKSVKKIVVK